MPRLGARWQQASTASKSTPVHRRPDLPTRFQLNAPLTQAERATFYGGGATGYTDYPPLTPTGSQHPSQESPVSEEPLAPARCYRSRTA